MSDPVSGEAASAPGATLTVERDGEPSNLGPASGGARRRTLAIVGLVLVVAVVVVIVTDPFGGSGKSTGGVVDNATATSLATVRSRSLSQQTQVSGTLGYAGSSSIRVPSGTAPSAVQQSNQQVTSAEAMLASARATLASDRQALADDQATLEAARAKEQVDCAGGGAAEAASANSSPGSENNSPSAGGSSCSSDVQAVSSAQQNATSAAAKVTADSSQVSSAEKQLASAQSNLSTARLSETVYGQTSTFTKLPSVGQVISRGQTLYAISGRPVVLQYGSPATRRLPLGSVVFESGPVRVTSVTPTVGQTVMPGPVLAITSTARQVKVALDASQQGSVKVGDQVTITLPDNQSTPGKITYVSSVATTPSSGGKGGEEESAPTVEVQATPTDPAATGHLDQAPVNVEITTEHVENVLAVPVDALLALAGGGYAVEVAEGRVHRLEAVTVGLFDDAEGVVQVSGQGLSAGQRVVVPQTS
jgi:multidrug efflux pump subunit AcrA (membrane-fusion protein)